MINKIILIVDKAINIALTLTFILIMCVGMYAIYDLYQVNESAQLSNDIISLKPEDEAKDFSLNELKKINSDIVAWIRINDTTIDYPIVKGEDNSKYLDKNYKQDFSITGSIFLDYRNSENFEDDYSVIYGHNMKADVMFSNIKKYENSSFFNSHLNGRLYTSLGMYKIEIIGNAKISAFENSVFNIISYGNNKNEEILSFFNDKFIFKNNIVVDVNDKLLLLSTCDEMSFNERNIILTKLTKISDNSTIVVKNKKVEATTNNLKNNELKIQEKKKLSLKDVALIILLFIVIIIYVIVIIQKVYYKKRS